MPHQHTYGGTNAPFDKLDFLLFALDLQHLTEIAEFSSQLAGAAVVVSVFTMVGSGVALPPIGVGLGNSRQQPKSKS